jgi:glycine cleavage system transcriptional repressor
MQHRYIMTAFGKDRPGIVADVTLILYENGCNLEDTTMSLLDDEFTINLLFTSGNSRIEKILLDKCRELEDVKGISAIIRPIRERKVTGQQNHEAITLHVEGLDQAGIVYRISQFLAERSLNIVDLKSTMKTTPESGTVLYLMDIHVQVPPETSLAAIADGLNTVAEQLNVDITLSS